MAIRWGRVCCEGARRRGGLAAAVVEEEEGVGRAGTAPSGGTPRGCGVAPVLGLRRGSLRCGRPEGMGCLTHPVVGSVPYGSVASPHAGLPPPPRAGLPSQPSAPLSTLSPQPAGSLGSWVGFVAFGQTG